MKLPASPVAQDNAVVCVLVQTVVQAVAHDVILGIAQLLRQNYCILDLILALLLETGNC